MTNSDGLFKSTYRLQFHKDFQFYHAEKLLPYLDDLGISHLYLSPVLEARPGSNHGYDGIDPQKISSERGGEKQLLNLLDAIAGMKKNSHNIQGAILDIVPNHLATHIQNPAWKDVLEKGSDSECRNFFDIYEEKILLPCLGENLEKILEQKQLKIDFHEQYGFVFNYFEQLFPICLDDYPDILLKTKASSFPYFDKDLISGLLQKQSYQLENWRLGMKKLNYRRFFDINELIGIKVEDDSVFQWMHDKIFHLLKHESLQGLRIDHIDGLLRPKQYLQNLRKYCSAVWVEKILSEDEVVPYDWPIHGTTGYDFSTMVTRIFVQESGYHKIHQSYLQNIDQHWTLFSDCVYESKKQILNALFEKELNYLSEKIYQYCIKSEEGFSFSLADIRLAIEEMTVCLKVYRLYYQSDEESSGIGQNDRRWLTEAADEVNRRQKIPQNLLQWMIGFLSENSQNSSEKKNLLGKWQQLSGPVMAKGFEDTALYRYIPLISLNTIGGQPDWNYSTLMEFHAFIQERLKSHPLSLNATTSHDTKRNEDVRSRIHVLSEVPELWLNSFESWHKMNQHTKFSDKSFEYFIYQTLLGVFPLDKKINKNFIARMQEYFIKAARESKLETNWLAINIDYEKKLSHFLSSILTPKKSNAFLKSLASAADFTAYFGAFNSLSELALKILSPGVPDTYQGTEIWSYYLVDPDNRRPVDFKVLQRFSKQAQHREKQNLPAFYSDLGKSWTSGEIKFVISRCLLRLRNQYPLLFENGKYIPLEIQGLRQGNALGFARASENKWVILVVPRFLASSKDVESELQISSLYWGDSFLQLPLTCPDQWRQVLTNKTYSLQPGQHQIALADLFDQAPIAVLVSETFSSKNERNEL